MDPESKKLLEETFRVVQENNQMLHRVRSIQKWSAFWQTFKVLVIIGIALGSFYFLQPYIDKMLDLYNSISGSQQKTGNTDNNYFQDFLKKF